MRISDWSSDVCSSDLSSILAGFDWFMFNRVDNYTRYLSYNLSSNVYDKLSNIESFIGTQFTDLFWGNRSEEHTSELQSLMRISYAVFCLKKKNKQNTTKYTILQHNTLIIQI